MKITLCIDKQDRSSPSSELRQYPIDIGCPLRSIDASFDELSISTDDNNKLVGVIYRRCYVDKYGVLKKLKTEEIQELEIPEIMLFEGANYVYIKEFTNLNMKIEYLTNAEMNKYFATKAEMNSSIKQTYDSIMLSVAEKADSKEVSAIIKLLSDEIALKVAKGDVVNEFNISDELISIIGNRLKIDTDNFKLTESGVMTATGANFVNGNINTDKDLIVGNNAYIGQNQSQSILDQKFLYFSENSYIRRSILSSIELLTLQSGIVNLKGDNTTLQIGEGVAYNYEEDDTSYQLVSFQKTGFSMYDKEGTVNINGNDAYISLSTHNSNGDRLAGINVTNSKIEMTHSPSIVSDKRFKRKIKDIDVSWIDKLKVKSFIYKNTPDKKQIGLIAQDYVDENYREYFLNKDDKGFYSINYGNITNALIKYCQQLNCRIIELEKQIKEMN